MLKSRLTAAVCALSSAGFLATWAYSQSPERPKNTANPFSPAANPSRPNEVPGNAIPFSGKSDQPVSETTDDLQLLNPAAAKSSKPSRIMFEANWKNVQVGSKPMHFRQGDRPFVWTIKNTGDNPVEIGNDYGFSISPGDEDFIVDTRLVLSVAGEKSTTVEVKASRVMTQSELSQEPQPTPVYAPTYGPSAAVPTPGGFPTYSPPPPADQFAPANPKGGRKPVATDPNQDS